MTCTNCSWEVSADDRFCGRCGHRLSQSYQNCGTENPLSHRFCSHCGSSLAGVSPQPQVAPAQAGLASTDVPRDERRWVTVMFAEVSNFTAMAEKMDPEDVMSLAAHCAEKMSQQGRHYGGIVLRIIGDDVLAVFGAPFAHEDDAERAVLAALAIRDLE